MQPSDLHGTSDSLDHGMEEELCWENGQLFSAHPIENTDRDKWTASPPSYSLSDIALQSTEEEESLKLEDIEDEKIGEATAFVTADDLTDLLDNLDSRGSVGMIRDILPPSAPRSESYALSTEMKRSNLPQHMPLSRGELEDLARLCRPSLQSGHLSVDARGRSVVPPLPFNIPRDDFSKLSDAVLNRISAQCMGSSSMQSLENTLLNRNARDTAILNAPRINSAGNLPSPSNATSQSSIEIGPSSDLDSMLLDSSGLSPGNGGKTGEFAGGKKARAGDDLDSDSEGSFDEMVAPRKPRQEQGPSSKRMRAAEIHNEAERKRRGKINEKLRVLQELIPNANKTDKASVLTEAIDYLKKLRLQLQMMCCRNGLVVSSFPVSQELQDLQMHHAGAVSNMEREIGATQGSRVTPLDTQRFPSTTSVASQGCSIPVNVLPFNEASFAATNTFVSSKGTGDELNTNSIQQVSLPNPFLGISQ